MAKNKQDNAADKKRLEPYRISWDRILPSGLSVPPGKSLRLSITREKDNEKGYVSLAPKDIDDVKRWIGVTDEVASKRHCSFECPGGASLIDTVSDLRNLKSEDLRALHAIGHEYVHGDSRRVAAFRSTLNVLLVDAVINGVFVRTDIDVYPKAVLVIGPGIRLLWARHIRIWQGGQIRIEGNARIDCVSIQGGVRRPIPPAILDHVPPLGELTSLEVDHA